MPPHKEINILFHLLFCHTLKGKEPDLHASLWLSVRANAVREANAPEPIQPHLQKNMHSLPVHVHNCLRMDMPMPVDNGYLSSAI
jgi:hypothetical protein